MKESCRFSPAIFFTQSNEWVLLEGSTAIVGIGEKAKLELGEIVYLQLPKLGEVIVKDEPACIVESTKAAIDISSPVSGVVIEVNTQLQKNPSLINQGKNFTDWLYKVSLQEFSQLQTLIPFDEYLMRE